MALRIQPRFDLCSEEEQPYHVRPDEIDRLVEALQQMDSPCLRIDTFQQHTGRKVYALTLTDPDTPPEGKRRLFVSRPHAHEPAGTAACAELVKTLLGYDEYAKQNHEFRTRVLEQFVVTFVPDANPGGSQRAPVKFWDGSEFPNEQFFLWMFGESGDEPGKRFPRVGAWDMRQVTPPALLGIAYEQIDEHTYVEPNRDHRSTFFQSFFQLDERYQYEVWLDLHQTEFVNDTRNCQVNLPVVYDELPKESRQRHHALGEAMLAAWREAGGEGDRIEAPYRDNEAQREFLARAWRPVAERVVHISTEVQNNNPRTPVPQQVYLQMVAVVAALEWMAEHRRD